MQSGLELTVTRLDRPEFMCMSEVAHLNAFEVFPGIPVQCSTLIYNEIHDVTLVTVSRDIVNSEQECDEILFRRCATILEPATLVYAAGQMSAFVKRQCVPV